MTGNQAAVPAQQQRQEEEPLVNGVMNSILRGLLIYMFMNGVRMYMDGGAAVGPSPGSSVTSTGSTGSTGDTGNNPNTEQKMKPRGAMDLTYSGMKQGSTSSNGRSAKPKCIWDFASVLDLHVYITDEEEYPIENCYPNKDENKEQKYPSILAEWHELNLVFGSELPSLSVSTKSLLIPNNPNTKEDKDGDNHNQNHNHNSNRESLVQIENQNQRSVNLTIPISERIQFNETHVFAHICMIRKWSSSDGTSSKKGISSDDTEIDIDTNNDSNDIQKDVLLKTVQLTKHKKRKRLRDEKNLLSQIRTSSSSSSSNDNSNTTPSDSNNDNVSSSSSSSPLTVASANKTQDSILLYLKPSLTLQLVNLKGFPTFSNKKAIPQPILDHMSWYNNYDASNSTTSTVSTPTPTATTTSSAATDDQLLYYPILHNSEFWMLKSSLVEVNDTIQSSTIEISIDDISFLKWQLMSQMETAWDKQSEQNGGDDDAGNDMFRTMLLETNPILLVITAIVSVLHTIFDILAFKNDISFFKGKKSMEGISLRSMVINTAFQLVILLYLVDNDTSLMILVSNGVGVAIEIWKISTAVKLSLFDADGTFHFQWKESETYSKSATKEYDEIATDHLMFVTMPLVCGYGIYSLFHQMHKGWYSWVLNTLVGFIYMFGFVMMTPQLFINYKLQSVAHLNWRTMTYKSINTFIDDLFAFVIKMPIMHRLACLRDDVIFLIFCYQRYKYRVDFTRVNEYGQCVQPTEEMIQENNINAADTNANESDLKKLGDEDVTVTVKKRRGGREKKIV